MSRVRRVLTLAAAGLALAATGLAPVAAGVSGAAASLPHATPLAPAGQEPAPNPRPASGSLLPGGVPTLAEAGGAPLLAQAGGAPLLAQPNQFFDAALFFGGLRAVRAVREAEPGREVQATPGAVVPQPPGGGHRASGAVPGEARLVGGLTSHHALAAAAISALFVELEAAQPATVILAGPNHENLGEPALTGYRPWQTHFGLVEVDRDLTDRLVATGLVSVSDEILGTDHAVGALMPYIKYHAPDARVVPLLLSRDWPEAQVRLLADEIAPLLGPDVLLIASVDFSHYLTGPEAEARDRETEAAIRTFDLGRLWQMGPDYLDSPQSLALLMLTMQQQGAEGPEVASHTNSGRLIGSDRLESTSYFTLKYWSH